MIKIFTDGSTRAGKNQKGAKNKGGFGIIVMNEDENIKNLLYNKYIIK